MLAEESSKPSGSVAGQITRCCDRATDAAAEARALVVKETEPGRRFS